ncbi:MAG: hypothetical protein ALECFALPRED_006752 [Alectoria fallacina]|uniref:F-box domain-containing protein n=1 Tax=Alectoria fallacina TaxID=1903189 RepID=A0A8H3IW95_9LECA|nr:MAG: hypothetical protein ALECFALPRED_006752 [Alectoria fallacina]
MTTLLSLANETLLQIVEETRPDSIHSFLRCCKRIWILGTEALEEHLQDLDRYEAPDFRLWTDKPELDFHPYSCLYQVLLKPRRALYVNRLFVLSLDFTLPETRKTAFTEEILIMIDNLCALCFKIVGCPYIQGDEVDKWVERIRHGDTNAVACLFLTLLPNIKKLSISDYSDQGYADLIYEVSKANQSPHRMIPGPLPLNNLHTIIINDTKSMPQPGGKLGIYEACMTLPSLRKLVGKHINCGFDRWPSGEESPLESNVTDIIFYESAINTESFARLFTKSKSLRHLAYGVARLPRIQGDYTAMGLKKCLEQHTAHTLTCLDLDFSPYASHEYSPFIGSLRQLQRLEHLRIRGNMFVDYSSGHEAPHRLVDLLPLLPVSIKTLTLVALTIDPSVTFTLNEIRKKREECLPNLTKLTWESVLPLGEGLMDACASVGIDLAYA